MCEMPYFHSTTRCTCRYIHGELLLIVNWIQLGNLTRKLQNFMVDLLFNSALQCNNWIMLFTVTRSVGEWVGEWGRGRNSEVSGGVRKGQGGYWERKDGQGAFILTFEMLDLFIFYTIIKKWSASYEYLLYPKKILACPFPLFHPPLVL